MYEIKGCIDYFLEQKRLGKIRYLGFSSHASVETLERFADACEWDFAQLQINYFDWEFGTAKAEYEVLIKRDIPIMVMEPVRGGRLARLTDDAEAMLKKAKPEWSIPSWAMRFVKCLTGVAVVLSGMNTYEQLIDNVNTFSDDRALTVDELDLVKQTVKVYRTQLIVPCTSCRYCWSDCPKRINIPLFIDVYNNYKTDGGNVVKAYEKVDSEGKPHDCIRCNACTRHCPQGIKVPDVMRELARIYEANK